MTEQPLDSSDDLSPTIMQELYVALQKLGAEPGLLRIVGGYRDALTDGEVLEQLRWWNDLRNSGAEPADLTDGAAALSQELYLALQALEAPLELQAVVGRWRDTFDASEVLSDLRRLNRENTIFDDIDVDVRKAE